MEKRVNLRLNVTEDERDSIRTAAALAGYRSMAAFCRAAALQAALQVADARPASLIRADMRRVVEGIANDPH